MNDRFLSRGKREDNGEWIEGFYTGEEYNPYIGKIEYIQRIQQIGTCTAYGIIPETLGGCTGLTDKNNKLMFEGDIIRYTANECCDIYFVKWDIVAGRFAAYGLGLGDNYPLGDFMFYDPQKCEVIGNIYDNPELLESEVAQNAL